MRLTPRWSPACAPTSPFSGLCARSADFRQGRFDTGYIDRNLAALGAVPRRGADVGAAALGAARLLAQQQRQNPAEDEAPGDASPWAARDGFQLTGIRSLTVPIAVDGERKDAVVTYGQDGMKVVVDGFVPAADAKAFAAHGEAYVVRCGRQTRVRLQDFSAAVTDSASGDGTVRAPMHGKVLALFVRRRRFRRPRPAPCGA